MDFFVTEKLDFKKLYVGFALISIGSYGLMNYLDFHLNLLF